jgi:hypothetical protein
MGKDRSLSVIAGALGGIVLGCLFYGFPAKFLISAPISADTLFLPEGMQSRFLLACLVYGAVPGVVIGALSGMVTPLFYPRGQMTKSFGAVIWLMVTALAWITQWGGFIAATGGRKAITILVTFSSFVLAVPVSGVMGDYIERIRE